MPDTTYTKKIYRSQTISAFYPSGIDAAVQAACDQIATSARTAVEEDLPPGVTVQSARAVVNPTVTITPFGACTLVTVAGWVDVVCGRTVERDE